MKVTTAPGTTELASCPNPRTGCQASTPWVTRRRRVQDTPRPAGTSRTGIAPFCHSHSSPPVPAGNAPARQGPLARILVAQRPERCQDEELSQGGLSPRGTLFTCRRCHWTLCRVLPGAAQGPFCPSHDSDGLPLPPPQELGSTCPLVHVQCFCAVQSSGGSTKSTRNPGPAKVPPGDRARALMWDTAQVPVSQPEPGSSCPQTCSVPGLHRHRRSRTWRGCRVGKKGNRK